MPNFGAKILDNAKSSLAASQAMIAATSNNIANVNTPGYSRRVADLQTRSAGNTGAGVSIGNGVEVGDIKRISDTFIERLLRDTTSTQSQDELKNDYLSRIQGLFNLSGDQTNIGSALTAFFSAINEVSLNPSSLELRSNLVDRGQDLVGSINTTYNTIANVQSELNQRLDIEVQTVNSLTGQIASLNGRISNKEATGTTAADERDQRDSLLNKLSEKVSFDVVDGSNGSINVVLSNGFAIVAGNTSRNLQTTTTPSFSPGGIPPSLSGQALSYVVYDYDSNGTPAHLDLTKFLKGGSGAIGGILQLRGYADPANSSAFQADGDLVAAASRVEAIARDLLTTFNQSYLGGDENAGAAGLQPSSGDLNGNPPATFGLFDFNYAGVKDVDGDGDPELSDITSGSIGIDNFASRIKMAFTDPKRFAAARDNDPTVGVTNFPVGDGQNAAAMYALRTSTRNLAVGNFSLQTSFNDAYGEMVTFVGQAKSSAELNAKVSKDNLVTTQNRRDEISGVSLDEEYTSLIKYQKAFQASAKMIKVADDILTQIVGLI